MKRARLFANLGWLSLCLPMLLAGGGVASATPYIFNSTESATPGALFYLQGDNFVASGGMPSVGFHVVTGTETALAPDVFLSGTQISSVTNQALLANLPLNIPLGLYAVWVKDAAGALSAPAFINRARGMSFEYGEVPAGYTFRIFGRNLALPGATPSVTFTSAGYSGAATISGTYPNDGNVLQVQAPSDLPNTSGTYTVSMSNGYGHGALGLDVTNCEQTILGRAGGTDVFNLGVPWGADFAALSASVINVVSSISPHTNAAYGADPTGGTNSVNAIQQALYDAGNPTWHPNGAVVYLQSGTFLVNCNGEANTFFGTSGSNKTITRTAYEELTFPSNVVLEGAGTGQTVINDATDAMPYPDRGMCTVNGARMLGMLNLTYQQSGTALTTSGTGSPILTFGGTNSFFSNLNLTFSYTGTAATNSVGGLVGAVCGGFGAGGASLNVLAQNITLDYGGFSVASTTSSFGAYFNVRNNVLTHHGPFYRTRIIVEGAVNLLFENNHCTRDSQWPGPTAYEQGGIECDSGSYATFLNNTFDAANPPLDWPKNPGNCGETFNFQGQPPQYDYGQPTAVTGSTITDTTKTWTTNIFAGQNLVILNGPGMGQWHSIIGNTAHTVTINGTFAENPTTASTYSLTGDNGDKIMIKGNTVIDQPRGVSLYIGNHDCAVVGNTFINTGETIYLRSDQRDTLTTGTVTSYYGRLNPAWHDVITDNICLDANGTWLADVSAAFYEEADSPVVGTMALGTEFRRNVLQGRLLANGSNGEDGAIGLYEGYNNRVVDYETSFVETGIPSMLATVFDDNTAIDTRNVFDLSTEAYQTSIWNTLVLSSTASNLVLSSTIAGATHAAISVTSGGIPWFFKASFNGTGGSTGGPDDMVDTGATGVLGAGTGGNTITVSSSNPMLYGGSYLEVTTGPTGSGASATFTPATTRSSWARIFDFRTGAWLVNGGFDFFWRPAQATSAGDSMRPIDISNNDPANGLELTFHNPGGSTTLTHEIIAASGGGGLSLTGTYAVNGGFTAGQTYHLGVTYSTNPATGTTTARLFAAAGTGAIITSGSGAAAPIATGTFSLNAAIVTDTNGFLNGGPWTFGDTNQNGTTRTNDYDGLTLYSADPGTFPALGTAQALPPYYWETIGAADYPFGMAVDGAGNVYVADEAASVIDELTLSGTQWTSTTIAGNAFVSGSADGAGASATFSSPYGVAVDGSGNVYVADTGNSTIRKLAPAGNAWTVSTIAGSPGVSGNADGVGGAARFASPQGVAVDATGKVFVADTGNNTAREMILSGTQWTVKTVAKGLSDPRAIAVDGSDNLYVPDGNGSSFHKLALSGTQTTTAATVSGFNYPAGVAVDGSGNVYVADSDNQLVRKLTVSGSGYTVTTIGGSLYGNKDGKGTAAEFTSPAGLALDGSGNIYMADASSSRIVMGIPIYPPAITSAPAASGTNGAAFSYQVQVPASNFPVTFAAAGLPSGLSIDPTTGLISGTPTVDGTYSVTVSASNDGGTTNAVVSITLAAAMVAVVALPLWGLLLLPVLLVAAAVGRLRPGT